MFSTWRGSIGSQGSPLRESGTRKRITTAHGNVVPIVVTGREIRALSFDGIASNLHVETAVNPMQ